MDDGRKKIKMVDGATGREINFAEMEEKSVKCAMWMKERNIQAGDTVGICTHNQVDMYVPCFASLYLGAVYNPWWHTRITKEMAKHFLHLAKPKVVFVDEPSTCLVIAAANEIKMELIIVVFGKSSKAQSLDDVIETQHTEIVSTFNCTKLSSLDEPAVIVFTSGTTGFPKGSLHSNRSVLGNLPVWTETKESNGPVTSMIFSPLAWATGVMIMLRSIFQYETRIIYPEFNEEKSLELIEKYKVNWMLLGTSFATRLHCCSSIEKYDLSTLKNLWITGGIVRREIQTKISSKFPGIKILQMYGSTELGGIAIMQNENTNFGSSGTIVRNMTMKIVDPESGRVLGPNKNGEALFKSPYMMTSYYDSPEATRETIDADGWLHSGDIAYYDESGQIYIVDRIKEIIKYRGNHVSPTMVEKTLLQHPGVLEVAVLGVPHKIDDELPIAFVLKAPDSKVTKTELEDRVANMLPDYMRLRGGVEFVTKMPHTASGKTAKTELKKLLSNYSK
ncbi:4-coumarate--CoA ligase 1-like isoform X2 [Venturia canescens]|uniref:4-coumarate--CoA ligase 1-like isoform X2 n=1 Tax=Venturia canescens TaxID=32260 RepID=UPI001C9D0DF4|nr:4-coumarate--CoA ligase 1-like isoform X2 [Venturia canescens]